ncbi:hypothetical protein ABZ345_03085 [Lentzea sp. NPDC005914]|uniref:hypothetical protein n=1 Tax=Lentzea sp. NPDC005914 TaxID=3154572 RepID=UPI0033DACD55
MTPPSTARRRARIALTTTLVACAALAVVAGLQHTVAGIFLVFCSANILFNVPLLAKGGALRLTDEHLTGATVSGARTVDLRRLVRVRRFRMPVGSWDLRMVELVDADGVRLIVSERTRDCEVRPVLEAHLAGATTVNRGWSYLAGLLVVAPPALIALAVHAMT